MQMILAKEKSFHIVNDSEIPHRVVFLDETWVFATGSASNKCSDGTASLLGTGGTLNTKWICF
jgi:hypothetical protein